MTSAFRFTLKNGAPGDVVDVYSLDTGQHLATEIYDGNGEATVAWDAEYGAGQAVRRRLPPFSPC